MYTVGMKKDKEIPQNLKKKTTMLSNITINFPHILFHRLGIPLEISGVEGLVPRGWV